MTTYQEDLIAALKDRREAAAYLNAAMDEGGHELYQLALRKVEEAYGGNPVTAVQQR
jgi:DNA-binding phage protein